MTANWATKFGFDAGAPSILVFHNVVSADAKLSTDYLTADFEKILDAALAMGVKFTTMSQWLQIIQAEHQVR